MVIHKLVVSFLLALLPLGTALALPDGSTQTPPYNATNALFDSLTKTTGTADANKKAGLLGYNLAFHDAQYAYTLPVCAGALFVEVGGQPTDTNTYVAGDTLVVSVQANAASAAKPCVNRVVRQQINRGSSGGECLQNYQVKQSIEGNPKTLVVKAEYTYLLTVYARPTLDCDGKAYGASPITTRVAPNQPFLVVLSRPVSGKGYELARWSLKTDTAGKASFKYTFTAPATAYDFTLTPAGNATAGDQLVWTNKVVDPKALVTPVPAATGKTSGSGLSVLPLIVILVLVLLGAVATEYRRWLMRQRAHELPEDEYRRVSKL